MFHALQPYTLFCLTLCQCYLCIIIDVFSYNNQFQCQTFLARPCVCEVGTVGKISDCQPEGPGFNLRPGRGLNFGRPSNSFSTPRSVDRDVKPLV